MRYEEIEEKLRVSPSLKFLRSRNAALMISFFDEQFKAKNEISLPHDYLVKELASLIEQIHYVDEEEASQPFNTDTETKAKRYIEYWTEENWLRNYIDENSRKVFNVLTKHTERVFQMLGALRDREFVGTESKFRDIFFKLEDIVNNSIVDPETRIAELEKQKDNLQREIDRIKKDGVVKTYEDFQVKSRMDDVFRLTNELVGDFKEVEDNFREITKNIYERQALQTYTKGNLLGFAFDSVDKLKESDQGKSFYSFWHFLMNENEQSNLRDLIEKSISAMVDRGLSTNDKYLRRIKTLLHSAGQKVLESNDQLGEKLSRVIAEKNSGENKKSRETIQEIRLMALQLSEQELPDDCGITLDLEAHIFLPLERKLAEGQVINEYDVQPQLARQTADLKALTRLFNPNLIDRKRLAKNVKNMLADRPEVSLKDVLKAYPLEKGLSELVAYITLNDQTQKVRINEKVIEPLRFDEVNNKYLDAPQIIYHK